MYEPNSDEINAVIIANDTAELKKECDLLVNDSSFPIQINSFDLFCQKTGHVIGTRSDASIFALVKICGRETANNIYTCTTLNVHPAWLHTDPDSLDELMESDPVGYAVFCLSLVTAQHYQDSENSARFAQRKSNNPMLFQSSDRLWALARANALLSQSGISGITELNIELARMVSFMPDATGYFFSAVKKFGTTPDKLAMLHCSGELINFIHNAINLTLDNIGSSRAYAAEYVKKTRMIDIAATPEDAARGPSNVRRQKVSKAKIAEAALFSELEKMFGETGLDKKLKEENLPGSSAWHEKMAARRSAQQNKEMEIAAQLAALMEVSNLAVPEDFDVDDDDNSVEVRIIPTSEIEEQLEQITQVIIPPAPRKLTALEMLRAKKGI